MKDKTKGRLFIIIGAIVLILTGANYLGHQRRINEEKTAKVICTTYPVYLLAKSIAAHTRGPEVQLLLPANTGCPHDYTLTPSDLMKLSGSRILLLKNGLGLDDALCETALKSNPALMVADTTAGFRPIMEKAAHCKKSDCKSEHHHGTANPHMFASPDMASGMVENITDALERLSPSNKVQYRKNAAAVIFELKELEKAFKKADFKQKNIAVQHDVFAYLARLAKLNQAVSLHADSAQAPSPAHVAELKKKIKENKVTVIFAEPQYPANFAKMLAKECGIKYAVLDPVASGPADADALYYVNTMKKNLAVLKEHLSK